MNKKDLLLKIILLSILYFITILVFLSVLPAELSSQPKGSQGQQDFNLILFILFVPILGKYSIHLLIVPWYGAINKRKLKMSNSNYEPKVSFIVPAWNEQVGIISVMKSVLNSRYKNFELIIVNDGSTDKTGQIVNFFIENYQGDIPIKYFKKENGGKASALNLGIKKATGEIIITTDADCAVDRYAIGNLVKYFFINNVMAVSGNVRVGNNKKIIGAIQKLEYFYGFYFKRADSILNSVYIVGGAAAAYRKEIFNKLGYFDKNIITEDIEYSTRILNAGYKICYATDAIFYTEVPTSVNSLIKQRLRWKYGRLKTFYKYRNLFFNIRGNHSKFLSFIILPVALFAEMLLFLEIILLPLFYIFAFLSGSFVSLIFTIIIFSIIISLQILTDVKKNENKNIIFWIPVAWLIFYFVDFIEYMALIKSIGKIIKKRNVDWQIWQRAGVFEGR